MYHHADQSWRKMPAFLSDENEDMLAFRLAEYIREKNLSRILVVFHGGEPLLAGTETIERIVTKIIKAIPQTVSLDFSLQTNGTLLNEENLKVLEDLDISVSLSIDGPENIHDKHRLNHAGKPSFAEVEKALKLLVTKPKIFTGVIAVIDAEYEPLDILQYFNQYEIPSLDFLLPDANYNSLPVGKAENPDIYKTWLIKLFDLWFDDFPHLRVRFFDAILDAVVGLPSKTDALGYGDVSLLTIETDGSYHDLDVLKVAFDGATNLKMTLAENSIADVSNAVQIQTHRQLLQKKGLSVECQECDIVDICAGGTVPHRYSNDGFNNPSVYCEELYGLISHAKRRLTAQLEKEVLDSKKNTSINPERNYLEHFEDTTYSFSILQEMLFVWGNTQKECLKQALEYCVENSSDFSMHATALLALSDDELSYLSIQPSVYAWTNILNSAKEGRTITSIDGKPILPDFSYVRNIESFLVTPFNVQRINRIDDWLRMPFGDKIQYENIEITQKASDVLIKAYQLIEQWDTNLLKEIKLIAPEVQFIKDFTAHPEKIVSFSDNSVPGALYVTVRLGEKFIEPADLADSILHEYRHQKLYLLQRLSDIVILDVPLVQSPWREELRPPSGLYHAIYVFTFLRKFWEFLATNGDTSLQSRARSEVEIIGKRINDGLKTVKQTKLTEVGITLLEIMEDNLVKQTA